MNGTAFSGVEYLIQGDRPAPVRQALRELWAQREVVWAFAERTTRLKYKQAVLGVVWVVLQPLVFLGIFVVVFARVGGISGDGAAYQALALSSLVPWFFLQTVVSLGAQALLMDSVLLRKVHFVREAPLLGAAISGVLDFLVGVVLLLIAIPFLGGRLTWYAVTIIPLFLLLFMLASGVALALGALNVYYRDFRFALPVLLQFWMYASPVAYPISAVPAELRTLYVVLNPAAGILDGFQRALARGLPPDPGLLGLAAAGTLVALVVGYRIFKRVELGFADAI